MKQYECQTWRFFLRFRSEQQGFTLLELMVTLAIIAILAAVAIPFYQRYQTRAYYSEVVGASAAYKIGVSECVQSLSTLTGCDAGTHHIPAAITAPVGAVESLTVADGVITVVPVTQNGIDSSDTYILTPDYSGGTITWSTSGGGVAQGYAK
jgi:type IV pilus assembly protein PilA